MRVSSDQGIHCQSTMVLRKDSKLVILSVTAKPPPASHWDSLQAAPCVYPPTLTARHVVHPIVLRSPNASPPNMQLDESEHLFFLSRPAHSSASTLPFGEGRATDPYAPPRRRPRWGCGVQYVRSTTACLPTRRPDLAANRFLTSRELSLRSRPSSV